METNLVNVNFSFIVSEFQQTRSNNNILRNGQQSLLTRRVSRIMS